MTKYIARGSLVDAWQLTSAPEPMPEWISHTEKLLRRYDSTGVVTGAVILRGGALPPQEVQIGSWIVNDRAGLIAMTEEQFRIRFEDFVMHEAPAQPVPEQRCLFDDDGDISWQDYDPRKPAVALSVEDHVYIELLKARLSAGEKWKDIDEDHSELVEGALGRMGYDL